MNSVGDAPSMAVPSRQTPVAARLAARAAVVSAAIEDWLEAEREQLPLWLPVALAAGIAGWFLLPGRADWLALIAVALAVACAGAACGPARRRAALLLVLGGLAVAAGTGLAWLRAERVAAPVLARPVVATFAARVERVQVLAARRLVRAELRPLAAPDLPPRVRVNIDQAAAPERLAAGDRIRLRARLMPPAEPAVPGAYDFARAAWFLELGATGRALGPVERTAAAAAGPGLRERLSAHVRAALGPEAAGIGVALATGDQGSVSDADAEALRRAGLAHLLSVSGLHISAVVGATMLAALHLLALSPRLALAVPLPLVAAAVGAAAGIFYTWLTGAEVPTIRACIAALLVLAGIAAGREAITLRLVATGALIVLLLWPEALVGASFQLSFAAVTAIIALHEHPRLKALLARREEGGMARLGRFLLALLLSGVAVELALAPIALFHFHKQGLYGALANIVAIPFTTFVVMPLEALALALDAAGIGAPLWWLTAQSIGLLLRLAHGVADAPGALLMLPTMPKAAFGLMVAAGLILCLLRTRVRWLGLPLFAAGALWAAATPPPDLLVTGDGRHLAVRDAAGGQALLRERTGDYVRSLLGEAAGTDMPLAALGTHPDARCGPDACWVELRRDGRHWRLLATRSPYHLPPGPLARACAAADIVVSDRRLPRTCRPRWLKLDRERLARSGGVAIRLGAPPRLDQVADDRAGHPWAAAAVPRPDQPPPGARLPSTGPSSRGGAG